MSSEIDERLIERRRRFHRCPEPAWREFYTTSLLVEALDGIGGVDELAVGREAMRSAGRMAVPSDAELSEWVERARNRGAREDVLSACEGGHTGCVAVLERGEGPSIGLRVDIDGLFVAESSAGDHRPAREGFRSEHEGLMHACGHDAHMAIGLGVIEAVKESEFEGTLTVFFQPAEEEAGGGRPMAEGPYIEGIEYLLCVHVGLDHPTGEVVAGIEKPLAMSHLDVTFTGAPAHAGTEPNEGKNAIQAIATAVSESYAIPRHAAGMTRVNVGRVEAGTASNVIAEEARITAEVRGETTELMEYMKRRFERVCAGAARTHGCAADVDVHSESPRADSDPALSELVFEVARGTEGVTTATRTAEFGASEDATFLMKAVQKRGGLASYLVVGTDHPGSHHTPGFDVDERSLPIAVAVLSGAIERLGRDHAGGSLAE
ncbi:MAG: amidohydrolase [Halalkalicoccus sp.]